MTKKAKAKRKRNRAVSLPFYFGPGPRALFFSFFVEAALRKWDGTFALRGPVSVWAAR
jgi:hypothetical protein